MERETGKTIEDTPATLASYTPTEYQVTVWPKLDTVELGTSFTPLVMGRMASAPCAVDPMFSDFDSSEGAKNARKNQVATAPAIESENALAKEEHEPSESQAVFHVSEGELDNQAQSAELIRDTSTMELSNEVTAPQLAEDSPHGDSTKQEGQTSATAQAEEAAYARGQQDTRAEVDEMKSQLEKRFNVVLEDLQLQVSESVHACERNAVELALQVARKLVGEVVESKREYVVQIIQDALKAVAGSDIMAVRVSPQDHEYLSLNKEKLGSLSKSSDVWQLQSDDSIRAGCFVTTSAGEVDFDLDRAWSRIREKVLKGPQS